MAPTKAQLVLNAVVTLKVHFQMDEAPKQRVQTMTAIKAATFAPLISRMVGKGLLEYGSTPGTLIITSKGETKAEPMEVATTNKQVQEEIKKKLKGKVCHVMSSKLPFYLCNVAHSHASLSTIIILSSGSPHF